MHLGSRLCRRSIISCLTIKINSKSDFRRTVPRFIGERDGDSRMARADYFDFFLLALRALVVSWSARSIKSAMAVRAADAS